MQSWTRCGSCRHNIVSISNRRIPSSESSRCPRQDQRSRHLCSAAPSDQCTTSKRWSRPTMMDHGAHRHPRAPPGRQGRGDQRSGGRSGQESAGRNAASSPSELDAIIVAHRHARHVLSLHRLPGAAQAGSAKAPGDSTFPRPARRLFMRLQTGAQFVSYRRAQKGLVIGADVMSSIIDYTDRATCVIFGDGAGAVLLEPPKTIPLDSSTSCMKSTDPAAARSTCQAAAACIPPTHETVDQKMHYVHQDGQAVFKFAVRKHGGTLREAARAERTQGKRYRLPSFPHQANRAHHHGHRRPPGPDAGKRRSSTSIATATPRPALSRSPWTPHGKKAN